MIIGIDYSVTSPAIVAKIDGGYKFFCYRQKKKHKVMHADLVMLEYPLYNSAEQRFDLLASGLLGAVEKHAGRPSSAFIEAYAYSGSGMITTIAEATGCIKQMLYKSGVGYTPLIASSIKKHASGKGNASKREMVDAFKKEYGQCPYTWFDIKDDGKEKIPSPVSDIVDAYFVLQCGIKTTH
jgi:Holliday junction resolvasome RuvABC endonuclease subunit